MRINENHSIKQSRVNFCAVNKIPKNVFKEIRWQILEDEIAKRTGQSKKRNIAFKFYTELNNFIERQKENVSSSVTFKLTNKTPWWKKIFYGNKPKTIAIDITSPTNKKLDITFISENNIDGTMLVIKEAEKYVNYIKTLTN